MYERHRKQQELRDDRPRESFAYELAEILRDVVEQEQRRERGKRKHQRREVLF